MRYSVFLSSVLLVSLAPVCTAETRADDSSTEFARDVLPILQKNCFKCHNAKKQEGDLDLRTRDNLLRGGESGNVIVPGKSVDSLLIQKIKSGEMPPEGPKLSAKEQQLIKRWINAGALLKGEDADAARRKLAAMSVTEANVLVNVFHSHCIVCHGKWKKEAGLDLRTRAGILKGGKSGSGIVPGKPNESLVLKKITADEMPPKKNIFGDANYVIRVPVSGIEKLKQWIERGAPAAGASSIAKVPTNGPEHDPQIDPERLDHWAFKTPVRPNVPTVQHAQRVRTPIDNFLLKRLEEKGLAFSPDAERLTLLRRATFALTGLAPEPVEVDAVLKDKRSDWYERLIDRLLDSRHYGERWGVYWLDAAGYSDTHGQINRDELREFFWRYRDYVIRSLNDDKPYDRFLTEQIAGDELFDYQAAKSLTREQLDALIATGFLRTGSDGTDEGALNKIPNRHAVIDEQIDIFSTAVMGLTLECARCHSHKFDPIPQRDYYRFAAIFRAAYDPYDWRIPNHVLHPPQYPVSNLYQRYINHPADQETPAAKRYNAPIRDEIAKLLRQKNEHVRQRLLALPTVVAQYRFDQSEKGKVRDSITGKVHGTTTGTYSKSVTDYHDHEWCLDLRNGGSVTITETAFPLHAQSAGDSAIDFFVKPMAETGHYGSVFWTASTDVGDKNRFNLDLKTFDKHAGLGGDFRSPDGSIHRISKTSHGIPKSEWLHIAIVRRKLDDGRHRFEWYFNSKLDSFQTQEVDGKLPDSTTWTIGGRPGFHVPMLIDEVRLWRGSVQPEHLGKTKSLPTPAQVKSLLAAIEIEETRRTEEQKQLLKRFHQLVQIDDSKFPKGLPEAIADNKSRLLSPMRIHSLTDTGGEQNPVFVLRRGEIDAPGQRVAPGVPIALTRGLKPYLAESPKHSSRTSGRRLALAKWLIQPNHPLTSRVFVNRIWHHHFGRGLVTTTGNFGRKGTKPSHPKLLDWLATRFVENGWSIKSLHRLIMTSTVWRQQSLYDKSRHQADPDNVLLSRFPFRRLDAEAIRDSLLQVSGRLDRTPFGPAVDVWKTSAGEYVSHSPYGFRRSIYVIRRRLKPVTLLDMFDAPAMVPNCTARTQSTVATQALQLYNSEKVRTSSERLAQRVLASGVRQEKPDGIVRQVYLFALSRPPAQHELERDTKALKELNRRWSEHLSKEKKPNQQALAWQKTLATYCHTILNSPEFVYVD